MHTPDVVKIWSTALSKLLFTNLFYCCFLVVQRIHVAHGAFWVDKYGNSPAVNTLITMQDLQAGLWRPRKDESMVSPSLFLLNFKELVECTCTLHRDGKITCVHIVRVCIVLCVGLLHCDSTAAGGKPAAVWPPVHQHRRRGRYRHQARPLLGK